jgi:hypothetical protein
MSVSNFRVSQKSLQATGCITDVGGFDAGQAQNVKPHIDLMLKLK